MFCDGSAIFPVINDDGVRQRPVFPHHSVPGQFLRQRLHVGSRSAAHAALAGLVPLDHGPHRGHMAHPAGGTAPPEHPFTLFFYQPNPFAPYEVCPVVDCLFLK